MKLSANEMSEYYRQIHRRALLYDREDALAPVIIPGETKWVNRFTDYAHRLGFQTALRYIEEQWGSLRGRSILDLGCGRGRWVEEFSSRGGRVTGVDVSREAVQALSQTMPQHWFVCQDITRLEVERESFDLVNSVTVLQHMPEEAQRASFQVVADAVKRGGFVLLLENVCAFNTTHVFPHKPREWISLAKGVGLSLCLRCPSNFECLFRAAEKVRFRHSSCRLPGFDSTPSITGGLKSSLKTAIALCSFPIEWFCHKVPLVAATHEVMVFRK